MTVDTNFAKNVENVFRSIQHTRMVGIPILNPALDVEVVGLQNFGDDYLYVLITPWFMNLMIQPLKTAAEEWTKLVQGEIISRDLPSGNFSFVVGREEGIGTYLSCSMFSPVFEFAAHDEAVETAKAIIVEVMGPSEIEKAASSNAEIENPSRRKLFGLKSETASTPA